MESIWKEIFKALKPIYNLLYWTMIAACTVGPGMVVTCARAGAEYQLHLIWPLIIASIFAYISLEGTARLTIVSGKSLGECLQLKYSNGRKIWNVGIFCWVVVMAVFSGNLLYTCNCFAGGMGAIYSLPPASPGDAIRIISCIVYGVIVIAILFTGKTNALGVWLGGVMVGMVILFLIVVIKLGLDFGEFFKGVLPISMPSGSVNIVMSLIGTTGTGFNLFLAGEMARGKKLPEAQRGIAFSTVMTFMVSVLILIVGSGTHKLVSYNGSFSMANLAHLIVDLTGSVGIWTFGIGFIAAALSSMLTIPLGAALTAESVLTIRRQENSSTVQVPGEPKVNSVRTDPKTIEAETNENKHCEELETSEDVMRSRYVQEFPKKYFNALMFVMVLISVIVMAANAPEVEVILVAQVYNGCLLPFFYICLLLCINDDRFMNSSPQKGWANCCLITGAFTTVVFTFTTLMDNIFCWVVTHNFLTSNTFETVKLSSSLFCSIVLMAILFRCTQLGNDVKRSFGIFFKRTNARTHKTDSSNTAFVNRGFEKA